MFGRVCELCVRKTDTFLYAFFMCSSSKVRRLELQVYLAPESESLPDPQREEEFADADEGGEDFFGGEEEADDPPEDPKPAQTVSPPRPSLTQ